MKLIISNSSNVPIYEQIKENIIDQILNNELLENEPLPSIRNLAQDIRISVMTVKKAYDDLEQDGFIITRQGKGSFVAPQNLELIREQKQREMEDHLDKAIMIAKTYHINKKEITGLIDYFYGEEEK